MTFTTVELMTRFWKLFVIESSEPSTVRVWPICLIRRHELGPRDHSWEGYQTLPGDSKGGEDLTRRSSHNNCSKNFGLALLVKSSALFYLSTASSLRRLSWNWSVVMPPSPFLIQPLRKFNLYSDFFKEIKRGFSAKRKRDHRAFSSLKSPSWRRRFNVWASPQPS